MSTYGYTVYEDNTQTKGLQQQLLCCFWELFFPPFRGHAIRVAAVSPLHGIPLITTWSNPANANQHQQSLTERPANSLHLQLVCLVCVSCVRISNLHNNVDDFTWIGSANCPSALDIFGVRLARLMLLQKMLRRSRLEKNFLYDVTSGAYLPISAVLPTKPHPCWKFVLLMVDVRFLWKNITVAARYTSCWALRSRFLQRRRNCVTRLCVIVH